MMDKKLDKKVALITGGSTGIGRAITQLFAKEGAQVAICNRNQTNGEEVVSTIQETGGEALFIKTDVSKTDEVKKAIEITAQNFEMLHTLVNCAASYEGDIFRNIVEISEKDWNHIIDVNLNGYFRFSKYAIPLILRSGGGTIINISSMAAFKVIPNFSVYPVTKAAINALTRTLAVDFAPQIRTNAICPGFVKIANSESGRTSEELKKWYKNISQAYPLKRVCTTDEIAKAALFLASDDSSYINGECIAIDGGKYVSDMHEF